MARVGEPSQRWERMASGYRLTECRVLAEVKRTREGWRAHDGKVYERLCDAKHALAPGATAPVAAPKPKPARGARAGALSERRVLDALARLGPRKSRVLLRDLRRELGAPDKGEFTAALLSLQDRGRVVLYREDGPGRAGLEDDSTIYVGGHPRHIVYLT